LSESIRFSTNEFLLASAIGPAQILIIERFYFAIGEQRRDSDVLFDLIGAKLWVEVLFIRSALSSRAAGRHICLGDLRA
jgi:hypothetical protein